MYGTGTLVNAGAIFLGGVLGTLLKKGIPERIKEIIFTANALSVLFIAVLGVVTASVRAGENGVLSSSFVLGLTLSLVLGGVLGELINIDRGFIRAGELLSKKVGGDKGAFAEGFSTTSILFCTGAMAIIGSINDGALHDPSMLYTKAILDGVMAMLYGSVYGIGVSASAFAVLVYQGVFTVGATWLTRVLSDTVVTQMSLVGSAILVLLSFQLWGIKKFRTANLIPAIFMPIALSFLPL